MNLPFSRSGFDTPVGTIVAYAGIIDDKQIINTTGTINNIQAYGWIVCDGREVPINVYPELFQAIGFLYSKEGKAPINISDLPDDKKFKLPDYRGYFLRGDSGDSGNDPDADERKFANGDKVTVGEDKTGSIQEDALQKHQHQYSQTKGSVAAPTGPNTVTVSPEKTDLTSTPTDSKTSIPGGIRVSSETRAKNFYVNYLIKFANLY